VPPQAAVGVRAVAGVLRILTPTGSLPPTRYALRRTRRSPPPPFRGRTNNSILAARFCWRPSSAGTKQTKPCPSPIFVRRRRWWDRPPSRSRSDKKAKCFPDKMRRASGASPIRDLRKLRDYRRSRFCSASLRAALRPGNAVTNRKRNADKRCSTTSASYDAARALFSFPLPLAGEGREGARSPVGVPPRHLRQRPNATAQLQPRDFPGRGRSARPDGSKDGALRNARPEYSRAMRHRGRYPRLPVPAQRDCTRRPVMMPAGRVLPKPPGSTGDEPMPAGTAPAPPPGGPPDGVLVRERD
jgi:hypothetical protein